MMSESGKFPHHVGWWRTPGWWMSEAFPGRGVLRHLAREELCPRLCSHVHRRTRKALQDGCDAVIVIVVGMSNENRLEMDARGRDAVRDLRRITDVVLRVDKNSFRRPEDECRGHIEGRRVGGVFLELEVGCGARHDRRMFGEAAGRDDNEGDERGEVVSRKLHACSGVGDA